jgi:hypothetical protein
MAKKQKKTNKTEALVPGLKNVLSTLEILKKLHTYGYFGSQSWAVAKKTRGEALAAAIREYQRFNGLEQTGVVGVMTAHTLGRYRCGLPDFNLTADGETCKWPHKNITYYSQLNLPGLTADDIKLAYDTAFAQWSAVCDIDPIRVDGPGVANIFAKSGKGKSDGLDDRGGTLAWSELPCGVTAQMQLDQMFDEAEDWSFEMAVAVICHEVGHALGLAHLGKGNLMAPYYDPNVRTPQKGDIAEMVALYGKRKKAAQKANDLKVAGTLMINGKPYMLVPQF